MRDKRRPGRLTIQSAEDIAARAILFLADDAARLGRFLAETGLEPATLREKLKAPETMAAVLGHLMADESSLLAFSANAGIAPEDVARAEAALGGGSPWDST